MDRHDGIGYEDGPLRARLFVDVGADIPSGLDRPDLELIAYSGDLTLDEIIERVADSEPISQGSGVAVYLVTPT